MKDKIIVYSFVIYLLVFSLFGIILKDKEISFTERRKLKDFPEFTLKSDYSENLEKYLLDQFPLRDNFRSLKANFNDYIFKKEDLNKNSIDNFINHIEITKSYLNEDNNTYMLIIPDKSYYLDSKDYLKLDYDYIYNEIDKLDINKIDIRNIMELLDYYQTDTHWRQEKIEKIVKKLDKEMSFNYQEQEFIKNTYNKFYGVYYGEVSIKRNPDELIYLTNNTIDNVNVKYLENKNLKKIYNIDKLNSFDSYEVYLDGASSFIEIENKNSKTSKELVIFRDSFASSLTPYLINNYKKITLIDNRYINSLNYKDLITFTNQDILFMYSTLIVNNSFSLKN